MAKLLETQVVTGTIQCVTGLKIGGTKDTLEIGGIDNPVIKHPISGMPYIPGSSLKGKLRALLEIKYGKFNHDNGEPTSGKGDPNCKISRIFGPHKNIKHDFGPTRIIVRDAKLTEEWENKLKNRKKEIGSNFLDVKQEVSINRKTGAAALAGPRTQERVPEGIEFEFEFVLRNFDWNQQFGDERVENLKTLVEAMKMLENDYLGGSGSRGYGKIKFKDIKLNGEDYEII